MAERILIIDDEHSILRLSQLLLQRKGFEVTVSLSVSEAKNILAEDAAWDLIVLDLMMPEENGFDFIEWVSGQSETIQQIPIIVNTAKILSEEEKSILGTHCKKVIPKGIDFTENLVAEVSALF